MNFLTEEEGTDRIHAAYGPNYERLAAVKARADGEAYVNLKVATAQAEALKIQNAALSQNKDVLELRRIEVERAFTFRRVFVSRKKCDM